MEQSSAMAEEPDEIEKPEASAQEFDEIMNAFKKWLNIDIDPEIKAHLRRWFTTKKDFTSAAYLSHMLLFTLESYHPEGQQVSKRWWDKTNLKPGSTTERRLRVLWEETRTPQRDGAPDGDGTLGIGLHRMMTTTISTRRPRRNS
jgi:hypothetical protein